MSHISLRQVKKSYGKTPVVHGVDLEIQNGEFVVILGPSGCGKSTLLRMVAGLEAITSGEIDIGGTTVNKLEPRQRGCAMVFQNYALYPHMSVAENIGYSLRVAGFSKHDRTSRIKSVADALGLADFLDRKPGQLSGGQRQRVAMGRAMIREPKVFLYDEPLSNLDARLRVAMRVEIRKLHQKLGTTTLFVTHDQVEAMTLADRIVVMNKGTIEQVGTPADVYGKPRTTYVASFIGTPGLNLLRGTADPAAGVVRLADGQCLAYDQVRWSQVRPGAIVAGFRAEVVELTSERSGFEVSYQFSEELGSSRLLHCEVSADTVIALSSKINAGAACRTMRLSVPPDAVHLFDAATGLRLGGELASGPQEDTQRVETAAA